MNSPIFKRPYLFNCIALALLGTSINSYGYSPEVEFKGFATFIYAQTLTDDDKEDTFAGISDHAEYTNFNNIGLRMDADLYENLTATVQVLAEGHNEYEPEFDWVFATYALTSELSLSVGKVRVPVFMYSDYFDTSYAYQWLEPPKVVYNADQTPFKSMDGLKLAYTTQMGDWNSELLMWGGESDEPFTQQGLDSNLLLEDAYGVAWTIDRDWLTLRAVYFTADVTLDVLTNKNLFGLFYGSAQGDITPTKVTDLGSLITEFVDIPGLGVISNPGFDPAAFPGALEEAGLIEGTEGLTSALLGKSVFLQKVRDDILVEKDKGYFYGLGATMDFGQYFIVSEITQINSAPNIVLPDLFSAYVMFGDRLSNEWTIAFTYGKDTDRANEKVWESVDSYLIASPTTAEQAGANQLLNGVRDVLEEQTKNFQNYDVVNYTFSTRWDFHKSAALKFEYLIQHYTVNFNDKNTSRPEAFRIGLDLVF